MNTGGSAFPGTEVVGSCDGVGFKDGIWHNPGMTLRDYFAAKAMQQLMKGEFFGDTAMMAYAMADAMLKEREK
jgi:hypothetical protein